jgi:hypothetical protein
MLGVDQFDMTDRRLRQAKNEPDLLFGGLGLTMSGDLMQLPPVERPSFAKPYVDAGNAVEATAQTTSRSVKKRARAATSMSTPDAAKDTTAVPNQSPAALSGDQTHHRLGYETYLKFTTVVSLDVNIRAAGPLGDIQDAMRRRAVTPEIYQLYARRRIGYSSTGDDVDADPRLKAPPFSDHTIHYVVHRHKLRAQQSLENTIRHCVDNHKRLYSAVASDTVRKSSERQHLTQQVLRRRRPVVVIIIP